MRSRLTNGKAFSCRRMLVHAPYIHPTPTQTYTPHLPRNPLNTTPCSLIHTIIPHPSTPTPRWRGQCQPIRVCIHQVDEPQRVRHRV